MLLLVSYVTQRWSTTKVTATSACQHRHHLKPETHIYAHAQTHRFPNFHQKIASNGLDLPVLYTSTLSASSSGLRPRLPCDTTNPLPSRDWGISFCEVSGIAIVILWTAAT